METDLRSHPPASSGWQSPKLIFVEFPMEAGEHAIHRMSYNSHPYTMQPLCINSCSALACSPPSFTSLVSSRYCNESNPPP